MRLARIIPLLAALFAYGCDPSPAEPAEYPVGEPIGMRLVVGSDGGMVVLAAEGTVTGGPLRLRPDYFEDEPTRVEVGVLSLPNTILPPLVSYQLRILPRDTTVVSYESWSSDPLAGLFYRKRTATTAIVVDLFDRTSGRVVLGPYTLPLTVEK